MSDDRRAVPSGEVAAPGSAPARAIARAEAHEHRPLPDEAEERIGELLDLAGARDNRDLLRELISTALRLADGTPSRLDMKIAASALSEMARAFALFAPFRGTPKLTMFGSARTRPDDPLYAQARELASRMAAQGWMVVTGAGPGIMAAGTDGAGAEMAIGVDIRLPFESVSHPELAAEGRLVEMKYFFTRKLMLMKESAAFAVLPGGFGTLDEAFELLTLLQTGKAEPAPIVLVDLPEEPYWGSWDRFVAGEVIRRGLASPEDRSFFRITADVDEAVGEIVGFYRNYHSRRFVGNVMVIRLRHAPSDEQLAALDREFADICSPRGIWRTGPLPPERSDRDHLDLPRIALELDLRYQGRLRQLIDALNALAPPG
ncbi:MAG TPA: TIGR00730 family Rossman fold protein [Acidimicrobiales bacterium]|nr:TIGR00730 family Rossman fold protein [Acidimicrobiales bacterium]